MKVLGENGLARLISKTKTALNGKINTTDIVTASTLDIDNTPTASSNNLVKSGGVKSALDAKQNSLASQTAYTSKGTATKVPQITTNSLGQVTNITEVTITQPDISGKLDKYTASGVHTVYANNSGTQTNLNYGTTATSNYIVQRQNNGQITVPSTPSADTDAASKQFVNSSIATNTANFLGTLDATTDLGLTKPASHGDIVTALNSYTFASKTNNDYCFVINKDSDEDTIFDRFKWSASETTFKYEYSLNNSSFTQAQWNAINSGITSTKVATYDGYASLINGKSTVSVSLTGSSANEIKYITVNGAESKILDANISVTDVIIEE